MIMEQAPKLYNCNCSDIYPLEFKINNKKEKTMGKFEKAKRTFYFTIELKKGSTVLQGDMVYIAHPNNNMEGWYQKLKDINKEIVYKSINTKSPKQYLAKDLEKYERAIRKHGTITKIVSGADNVQRLLNNLIAGKKITENVLVVELKPTLLKELKPLIFEADKLNKLYKENTKTLHQSHMLIEQITDVQIRIKEQLELIEKRIIQLNRFYENE